jgi:hypothetical protein
MNNRKLAAGAAGLCLALGVSGVAVAANTAAVPKKVTIEQSQSFKFVPNRYVKDGLRWKKDVYTVKSGGTLHLVNSVITEGPHTFSVVRKKDLPKTAAQANNCKICQKLGQAHGFDPNSEGPPKFFFLENGTGSTTPPSVDRPGDSALIGPGNKRGEHVDLKITAKRGTTLYFMCLIHPQMQSKIIVK